MWLVFCKLVLLQIFYLGLIRLLYHSRIVIQTENIPKTSMYVYYTEWPIDQSITAQNQ